MRRGLRSSALAGLAAAAAAACGMSQPVTPPDCDPDDGGLQLSEGFCAYIFADDLGRARHLTVADNGDVYVRLGESGEAGGGIAALRDTTGDGRADLVHYFEESVGTGIAVQDGYLFYSTDVSVHRYAMDRGELVPSGEPETIIAGFPDSGSHGAKSFAFDGAGAIFVNAGAPSNACEASERRAPETPGHDPCPELELTGGVWRYDANEPGQQHRAANRYSTGIRNAVALAWNPVAGRAYAVQHGRDQLDSLWPDVFTTEQNAELPSEELLLLEQDADFGWPYCYHDPQRGRVLSPEYGGDGAETDRCARHPDPLVAFPAHWAPNDLLFYSGDQFPDRYHGGAFVAFHGSWNRAPLEQRGYKVVFVPMTGSEVTGDWEIFADDFAGIDPIESADDAEFRPMGLAFGEDGTMYVSDSQVGRIWRIIYTAE
jgi:glucose/arabinose dehydrogenase